jgi:hypothetical protein
MTHRPGEPAEAQIGRARSTLRQKTDALVQGSGLDIRELANTLVIHNPHDPGKGRIHITYTRSDVPWERSTWVTHTWIVAMGVLAVWPCPEITACARPTQPSQM